MLISGTLGADGVNGTGDASFCSVTSENQKKKISTDYCFLNILPSFVLRNKHSGAVWC